jgi:hypothetical protein
VLLHLPVCPLPTQLVLCWMQQVPACWMRLLLLAVRWLLLRL